MRKSAAWYINLAYYHDIDKCIKIYFVMKIFSYSLPGVQKKRAMRQKTKMDILVMSCIELFQVSKSTPSLKAKMSE